MDNAYDPRRAVIDAVERMGACTVYVEQDDQGRPRVVRLVELPAGAAALASQEQGQLERERAALRIAYLERQRDLEDGRFKAELDALRAERDWFKVELDRLRATLAQLAQGAAA